MIHIEGLWIFFGSAPVRLSTFITFVSVFVFVAWRFRSKTRVVGFYNAVVAVLFTFFLYEVLFNVTGGFPPAGPLPPPGVGLLICSIVLGLLQARKYFALQRLSIVLLAVFVVDWIVWIVVGFPFNLSSSEQINVVAEVFNVTTKLLLPLAYATGLTVRRKAPETGSTAPRTSAAA